MIFTKFGSCNLNSKKYGTTKTTKANLKQVRFDTLEHFMRSNCLDLGVFVAINQIKFLRKNARFIKHFVKLTSSMSTEQK